MGMERKNGKKREKDNIGMRSDNTDDHPNENNWRKHKMAKNSVNFN